MKLESIALYPSHQELGYCKKEVWMLTVYAAYGDRNFFENIKGKVDFLAKRLEEILSKLKITTTDGGKV